MSSTVAPSTPLRVLAPGGGFSSPSTILRIRGEIRKEQDSGSKSEGFQSTKNALKRHLSVEGREISLQTSGTQSLWQLFTQLSSAESERLVGIPAYTCPDVAIAAISAGWKVLPLEIDPETLDIASSQEEILLQSDVSALVLPNLYGMVDTLEPWVSHKRLHLIDDACQAALSLREGVRLGFAQGTYGVLSFGRGKAYSGVGGGALVYSSADFENVEISEPQLDTSVRDGLYGALMWAAERPSIYALPARMPWLGLGETKCDFEFKKDKLSEWALLHAIAQVGSRAERSENYHKKSAFYDEALGGLDVIQPSKNRKFASEATLLRYPVLLPNAEICERLYDSLWRFGVSRSYPSTLYGYKELQASLIANKVPQAEDISRRILSLPLHIYVRDSDMEMIASYFRRLLT